MTITLLWLRSKDSNVPSAIPKSWQVLHYPITEIELLTSEIIPKHSSILFTSKRSPKIIASQITTRKPVLCVGSETLATANKYGWKKPLLVAESAKILLRLIATSSIPSPILYVHGDPTTISTNDLLSEYNGSYNTYCCYKQNPIARNWSEIISGINPVNKLFIPILSCNTAYLWRQSTRYTDLTNLDINYFCFSLNITDKLGKLYSNESIHTLRKARLDILISTMLEASL